MASGRTGGAERGFDRRRALQAGAGAIGVAWVAPTILSTAAAAASAGCGCGGANLIVNPSGEQYTGNPNVDNALTGFAVPDSWALTNNFRVVTYGLLTGMVVSVPTTSQFLGPPTVPTPAQLGSVLFAGSFTNPPPGPPGLASSTAIQSIDVSSCAGRIDANAMDFSLSAWLGGYATQADRMTLQARFYGAGSPGTLLGSSATLTVTNTDRGNVTRMLFRSATGDVPVNTRRVEIQMTAIMAVIERYNAFADLLDFHLVCTP